MFQIADFLLLCRSPRRALAAQAALLLLLAASPPLHAEPVAFGLFGDTPYNERERARLPGLIQEMDAEALAFVIHDGDIKGGGEVCSDDIYGDRLALFNTSRHPLIFVPGDNEWTDCHRRSNGAHDPLERLAKLRQMFFAGEETLGRNRLRLERQSTLTEFAAFRENVRWQMGIEGAGVLFVGLNVPGSNNNYAGGKLFGGPSGEFMTRRSANLQWLRSSFALAKARRLAGLLLVIQGNPGFEAEALGLPASGFAEFLAVLRAETRGFPGRVVLVHGDSHSHRIDQPFIDTESGRPLANFVRVETYGSPQMGWVKGVADPQDPQVFHFTSRPLVGD